MDKRLRKAGIKESHFYTGDVRLNYVAGPDHGTPLVFIPGQSLTWEEYSLILPVLADRFQVFAVTLRGHGTSSWTPGQYTFNRLGEDLTAFLKGVVQRPAIVAGNSSGGVLAAWLAANAPEQVRAIVLEDPPLFRCDRAHIKDTVVYDIFLEVGRMAVPGSGGYAGLLARMLDLDLGPTASAMRPPKLIMKLVGLWLAWRQAFFPGAPIDLKMLPPMVRFGLKGLSQFDPNFSRAFVDGTVGEGFDHAETLARITQPVLFLHANWSMRQGRLLGALDDADVARVQRLVKGSWKYVHMGCEHAIALDAPDREAKEISAWAHDSVH